jgi:hypothetical protein
VAVPPGKDEEEAGFSELIAESEEAMPLFGQSIADFGVELATLGEIAVEHTARITRADESSKPASARLVVIRDLARAYEAPAAQMEALAADYVDQLARVDGGIRALIARVPALTDEGELASAREFATALNTLADQGAEGLTTLDEFRASTATMGQLSSTMRPVLRRIDNAVKQIVPSREVFRDWAETLNQAVASAEGNLSVPNETSS